MIEFHKVNFCFEDSDVLENMSVKVVKYNQEPALLKI